MIVEGKYNVIDYQYDIFMIKNVVFGDQIKNSVL